MYEFGDYGTRIQDPNDPDYEYRPGARPTFRNENLGLSSCTYNEVLKFINAWDDNYRLLLNNCQHFAKGLGKYLLRDCAPPVGKRSTLSDDDFAQYIFSLAEDDLCITNSTTTPSAPTASGVPTCRAITR